MPPEKKLTLRLPEDLAEMVEERVQKTKLSQNEILVRAIRFGLMSRGVKFRKTTIEEYKI